MPLSIDFHISEDIYSEQIATSDKGKMKREDSLKSSISLSIKRATLLETIKLIGICKAKNNNRIAILNAHGDAVEDEWFFLDNGKPRRVCKWVGKYDSGKYAALLIDCCNPSGSYLTAKKTHIFYPDNVACLRYGSHNTRIAEPTQKGLFPFPALF